MEASPSGPPLLSGGPSDGGTPEPVPVGNSMFSGYYTVLSEQVDKSDSMVVVEWLVLDLLLSLAGVWAQDNWLCGVLDLV